MRQRAHTFRLPALLANDTILSTQDNHATQAHLLAVQSRSFHLLLQGQAHTFAQAMQLIMRGCVEEQHRRASQQLQAQPQVHAQVYTELLAAAAFAYGLSSSHRRRVHTAWWRWFTTLEQAIGPRKANQYDEGEGSYERVMEQADEQIAEALRQQSERTQNRYLRAFAAALLRGDYRSLALLSIFS